MLSVSTVSNRYFREKKLGELPNEMIHDVFRLFDIMALVKYSTVCRRWNCLINDVRLWKKLEFGYDTITFPSQLFPIRPMVQFILRAPLLHTFRATDTWFYLGRRNRVVEFTALVKNCPCLQVLDVESCGNIHHKTWQKIASASWSLKRLSIYNCDISQEDLDMVLTSHSRLRVLEFTPPKVLYTLEAIAKQTQLTCLLLKGCHSTDSVLRLLDSIGAQLVQISLCQPDRKVLAALPKCTRLKVLALESLLFSTHKAVVKYVRNMTYLTHLEFGYTGSMPDHFFVDLFGVLCNLEFLSVSRDHLEMRSSVVRCITKTMGKRLRYLNIRHSGVLSQIMNKCPEMECLGLRSREIVVPQPLMDITSTMPKLRTIYVGTEELKSQMSVMFLKAGCLVNGSNYFPDISRLEWRDKQS